MYTQRDRSLAKKKKKKAQIKRFVKSLLSKIKLSDPKQARMLRKQTQNENTSHLTHSEKLVKKFMENQRKLVINKSEMSSKFVIANLQSKANLTFREVKFIVENIEPQFQSSENITNFLEGIKDNGKTRLKLGSKDKIKGLKHKNIRQIFSPVRRKRHRLGSLDTLNNLTVDEEENEGEEDEIPVLKTHGEKVMRDVILSKIRSKKKFNLVFNHLYRSKNVKGIKDSSINIKKGPPRLKSIMSFSDILEEEQNKKDSILDEIKKKFDLKVKFKVPQESFLNFFLEEINSGDLHPADFLDLRRNKVSLRMLSHVILECYGLKTASKFFDFGYLSKQNQDLENKIKNMKKSEEVLKKIESEKKERDREKNEKFHKMKNSILEDQPEIAEKFNKMSKASFQNVEKNERSEHKKNLKEIKEAIFNVKKDLEFLPTGENALEEMKKYRSEIKKMRKEVKSLNKSLKKSANKAKYRWKSNLRLAKNRVESRYKIQKSDHSLDRILLKPQRMKERVKTNISIFDFHGKNLPIIKKTSVEKRKKYDHVPLKYPRSKLEVECIKSSFRLRNGRNRIERVKRRVKRGYKKLKRKLKNEVQDSSLEQMKLYYMVRERNRFYEKISVMLVKMISDKRGVFNDWSAKEHMKEREEKLKLIEDS